ncbi:MAG: cytochrome b/b6 domain-containing protein [Pseudomonadota bacterium]
MDRPQEGVEGTAGGDRVAAGGETARNGAGDPRSAAPPLAAVPVWDPWVRLFHWTLAALVAFSWWSGTEGGNVMRYHMLSGYAILTLVLFRVLWGVVGSTHARFADFVRGPATVLAAARELFSRRPMPYAGHNPVGGWMALALLLALAVQAVTGLFANDDIFIEGPLYPYVSKDLSDALTRVHYGNFNVILALVAVHVVGVLYHWIVKRENLVAAMFTGRKRLAQAPPARFASFWTALAALAASAAAVAWVVNL